MSEFKSPDGSGSDIPEASKNKVQVATSRDHKHVTIHLQEVITSPLGNVTTDFLKVMTCLAWKW